LFYVNVVLFGLVALVCSWISFDIQMNENTLITLESGSEDEALNLLKDFNVKVLRCAGLHKINLVRWYSLLLTHDTHHTANSSLANF